MIGLNFKLLEALSTPVEILEAGRQRGCLQGEGASQPGCGTSVCRRSHTCRGSPLLWDRPTGQSYEPRAPDVVRDGGPEIWLMELR